MDTPRRPHRVSLFAKFTAVILLIIVSSILTPILLKMLYEKYPEAA